jgi:chitin disaccharide deacetylase
MGQAKPSGAAAAPRWLIVNADDFGLTDGVNEGILRAHRQGVVTSTSLMVRQPAATAAVAAAAQHPALGVGLHVDLWDSAPDPRSSIGEWQVLYQHCEEEPAAVAAEVQAQIERFFALMGRKPTHLDSHQHVHKLPAVAPVLKAAAAALGVPLRGHSAVRYLGGFYGQDERCQPWLEGISVGNLLSLVDALPAGATEFGCHPGVVAADEALGGTMYRQERNHEIATLTDQRVRQRLARGDVRLINYAEASALGLV